MKMIKNLRIGVKLSIGFGLCLALACALGLLAIERMAAMNAISDRITSDALQGSHDLAAIDSSLAFSRNYSFEAANSTDTAFQAKAMESASKELRDLDESLKSYGSTLNDKEDEKNYGDLKPDIAEFVVDASEFRSLILAGHRDKALALAKGKMQTAFHKATDLMDTMLEWNNNLGQKLSKEAAASFASARFSVIVLLIAAILIGLFVAVSVSRFIVRNLQIVSKTLNSLQTVCVTNLSNAISALEQGDLAVDVVTSTEPIEVETKEEFGSLATTCNALLTTIKSAITSFLHSQSSLSNLVRDLQVASSKVAATATNLASTSQEVEASAEEIGQTMVEVSNATEQAARGATDVAAGSSTQAKAISTGSDELRTLVTTIQSVAGDADSAAQAVEDASQLAAAGGEAVNLSVEGMKGILTTVTESAAVIQTLGQSSEKIGSIVQTIEDIAGQTNLLALNAAIEAARAGEAGRGFAVVADEVRKLAERSGSATREIAALIAEIQGATTEAVRSMESGVGEVNTQAELAKNAGESFVEIEKAFGLVTEQVRRISAASEHMTSASEQVSRSISEVAAVIEQSSAAAEELSASSEEVSASVQTVASSTQQQVAAVRDLVSSSESLSELAQNLQTSVSKFKPRAAATPQAVQQETLRLAA